MENDNFSNMRNPNDIKKEWTKSDISYLGLSLESKCIASSPDLSKSVIFNSNATSTITGYYSNSYGNSWMPGVSTGTQDQEPVSSSVACSEDFQNIVSLKSGADKIYYSRNAGVVYNESIFNNDTPENFLSLASRGDGKVVVALAKRYTTSVQLWFSNNYGESFNKIYNVGPQFSKIIINRDGTIIYLGGGINGNNNDSNLYVGRVRSTYLSPEGNQIVLEEDVATTYDTRKVRYIVSTIAPTSLASGKETEITDIACSDDGRHVYICTSTTGLIYYSYDFGKTFLNNVTGTNTTTITRDVGKGYSIKKINNRILAANWVSIDCIGNGKIVYVVSKEQGSDSTLSNDVDIDNKSTDNHRSIWKSEDYGQTWTREKLKDDVYNAAAASTEWVGINVSRDGSKVIALRTGSDDSEKTEIWTKG